jgi:hypothetical protein
MFNHSNAFNLALEVTDVVMQMDSDSDKDNDRIWGGSRPGRRPNKNCDFAGAAAKLKTDYFNGEQSTYNKVNLSYVFAC